ncbi:unnamed protein product [Vitrella brassicaformis CCMP3155]|uniref:Uncharacterized protein n=1 Tax=Vitrella brassicaformis (strain CCMP3155) TaxID=1169540 RepID=A0A0G4EKX4_VITBC|nr:unnamed protein product [Vitrella brassicaformis CCMP3155]|eukprot:CEL97627.1 unnamed protein product [Vitrella brassicaformis CCMP3155]
MTLSMAAWSGPARALEWCAEEEPSDIALPRPPPKATAPTEGGNGGPETTGGGARDDKKETKITKENLQVLHSASRLLIMTTNLMKAFESAWRDVPTAGFIRLLKLPSPPPASARLSRTPRTAIKRPAREQQQGGRELTRGPPMAAWKRRSS